MSTLITHLHDDLVNMLLDARPSLFPLLRAYVALGKAAVDRLSEEVPRTGLITYYWSDLPIAYGLLPPVPAIVTVFSVPVTRPRFLLSAGFLRCLFRFRRLLAKAGRRDPLADLQQHSSNQVAMLLNPSKMI